MSFTRGLACPTHGGDGKSCPCRTVSMPVSIFTAAEWGALPRLRERVNQNRSLVYAKDSGGYTMLHYAAQHGHGEAVKFLVEEVNAEVDAFEPGSTPLMRASYNGELACVDILLRNGASVVARDRLHGETSLHKAARQGHEGVVARLLQQDSEAAKVKDNHGRLYNEPKDIKLQDEGYFSKCLPITKKKMPNNLESAAMQETDLVDSPNAVPALVDKLKEEPGTTKGKQHPENVQSGRPCPVCGKHVIYMRPLPCCNRFVCSTCARSPTLAYGSCQLCRPGEG